jgi:aminoglycoside 6-adenylyltransferase
MRETGDRSVTTNAGARVTTEAAADPTVSRLIRWAQDRDSVRALILTSTRTLPDARPDPFSDYDVIVVVSDVRPYYEDRAWLEEFGKVLVVYRDPIRRRSNCRTFAYITQYESGLKIDFTLWPVAILARLAVEAELPDDLDLGYTVLLDKDDVTQELPPPSHRAYIPKPPSETEYVTLVEEFFHEATYVAKHLWRDDLLPAKFNLDQMMKQVNLRRMLEWRAEVDHDWSLRTRAYGSRLRKALPAGVWSYLEKTYVGAGTDGNWDALFATIELFRRVAVEVAEALGFDYLDELDRRVCAYLEKVRGLDRRAEKLFD